jgi:hypothetical protein
MNEDEAAIAVVNKGAAYWRRLLEWGNTGIVFKPSDIGVLEVAAAMPRKTPSGKQSLKILDAERRALQEGFKP